MKVVKALSTSIASLLLSSLFVSGVSATSSPTTASSIKGADLVIEDAKVYTVNNGKPWAEAIAIKNGEIVYVGSNNGVKKFKGNQTKVIDLDGKMVMPGMMDNHNHADHFVQEIFALSLFGKESPEEYLKELKDFLTLHPDTKFVQGMGWQNPLFAATGPTKDLLDKIAPNIPVVLTSEDGHSIWVNSKALELAGITKNTVDPKDGLIERDANTGEPNGTLREGAKNLVTKILPSDYTVEQYKEAIHGFEKKASSMGITEVHIPIISPNSNVYKAFKELEAANDLHMRYRASFRGDAANIDKQLPIFVQERSKNTGSLFQTNSVKLFMDGVVEGGTAWLKESYHHKDHFNGIPEVEPAVLNKAIAALDKEGFQVHVHSIGDEATTTVLDAFELAQKQNATDDTRHAITHLQLVSPEDVKRFGKLGVVADAQVFWDMKEKGYFDQSVEFLGEERANHQYPLKSFLDAGAVFTVSSDYPVTVNWNPMQAIQIGVTRMEIGETDVTRTLWPQERVSVVDMIKGYTYNGAYANFMEQEVGSIEPGKKADIIVLDKNLFEIPANQISDTKVLLTLFEGNEVYRDRSFKK
ncbi:amidohydrolase [Brevibacillus fluminis]|uniref:Amidohydrolase n=1 Tax=Brevibacillus fluminis TaxID=511487 RepID=A0A3M8DPZ8_9BACL|nr:amidohydrolase [Brevibacillus fluminis]RNB89521.1 amidohydrolase [Brevibacillus fluminis]